MCIIELRLIFDFMNSLIAKIHIDYIKSSIVGLPAIPTLQCYIVDLYTRGARVADRGRMPAGLQSRICSVRLRLELNLKVFLNTFLEMCVICS